MLADAANVVRLLRLPGESTVDVEGAGPGWEQWTVCAPNGERRDVVLRRHPDAGLANHVAMVETLARAGFRSMPAPLAALGDVLIEEAVPAVSALALVPPEGSVEAAMRALAEIHSLDLREGDRWGTAPEELLPRGELPLHRLGFAAHERDPALPLLEAAREAVLRSPWGLVHGDATAANVLLAPGRAWLAGFHLAGFGPQLYDVAAFLLTAGLGPTARVEGASAYARIRGLEPGPTADLVDLGAILWGVDELLRLPRRSIELLGDDASLAALNTAANRIERGIREPAGNHPVAAGIRSALWPA